MSDIVRRQEIMTKLSKDSEREIRENIFKINELCNTTKEVPIYLPIELVHGSCNYVKVEVLRRISNSGWTLRLEEEKDRYALE